ncbi:hypothetical protein [Rosistilla oblonga]|uniref:hypothetical protein n=1 Tax=Rosistilla oblonga TaxID=2527990 RepID=UPI003A9767AE
MNRAILFLLLTATSGTLFAQESDPFAPAEKLADGWEQIDQRLVFLMVRLVDVEANLEAVDIAMLKHGGRAGAARGRAIRAQRSSDRMDRNAGGPVRWDQFYGRTAEKFFYHPTQNHTYHTQTILSHQSPSRDNQGEAGVPSRQGLPVHQRPPQFDYIYRANENARQRATTEVAKLGNKIDALAERRHELELQQCKLWCEVAFRAVSRNDLDKKALYRFQPKSTGQEGLEESAKFVLVSLTIVENAQKDQASTFRQMKPLISKARDNLANNWSQHGVKYRAQSSNEWKFAMLARHLEDVASNLSDSYTVSVDSARNSDDDRRDMYRGLLQQSLVQYAEAVLALDEMASEMAKHASFEPDLGSPLSVNSAVRLPRNAETSQVSGSSVSTQPDMRAAENANLANLLEVAEQNAEPNSNSMDSHKPKPPRSSRRTNRPQTMVFQFGSEQNIRESWNLPSQDSDWQIVNGSLQLHGHKAKTFGSRFKIKGDCRILVSCFNKGWGGPTIHIFGERIILPGPNNGGPMRYKVEIVRQGNKLMARANNKNYNIQLKDSNVDNFSPIVFSYTDHNNSGILISGLSVTASELRTD